MKLFSTTTTALIFVFASSASLAATATVVDAKALVALDAGDYAVASVESALKDDKVCDVGATHTVQWSDKASSLKLRIGEAKGFGDFNAGLQTDSKPYYAHHCVYRNSTQALDHRIVSDNYVNCDNENTITHTEIAVTGQTLSYSSEVKISRGEKVVAIRSKCTLNKIKP